MKRLLARQWTAVGFGLGLLVLSGCGGSAPAPTMGHGEEHASGTGSAGGGSAGGSSTSAAAAKPHVTPAGLPAAFSAGKVELRDANGIEIYSFKPKEPGEFKFYDGSGMEICKLTFGEGRLKVKSPGDEFLFELKAKDDKVMIKNAADVEIFKFKRKGTELDLYAPGDKRLYRVLKEDYGAKLEDNDDQVLFRAKNHEGKLVLRDPMDKTVLASKDWTEPRVLVFFRMTELSREQQAACLLFFLAYP